MLDSVTPEVIFDLDSVLDMVDGEIDFMQELIELFLTELPAHLDTIRRGISEGDTEGVLQIAHRLKSSVGNLGGRRAQSVVCELEQQARTGSLASADELLTRCEFELAQFQQELQAAMTSD